MTEDARPDVPLVDCTCQTSSHCTIHDAGAWANLTDEQRRVLRAQVAKIVEGQ